MLDTSVAIPLRDGVRDIVERVEALGGAMISIITRVELEGGVYRDPPQNHVRRERLDRLLPGMQVLPFDEKSADAYQRILASAGYSRRKLLDRMIAAQALVHDATLITFNGDDFRDVPGLKLLEWEP